MGEGVSALATGLGATAVGYFIQGWFKFGGVEVFKIKAAAALGEKKAWENRTAIYLGAAAGAEFIADIFLCPLQGRAAEAMHGSLGKAPADCGAVLNTGVSLGSGVIAGVVSAVISHPALQFGIFDTIMRTLSAEKFHFHAPQ